MQTADTIHDICLVAQYSARTQGPAAPIIGSLPDRRHSLGRLNVSPSPAPVRASEQPVPYYTDSVAMAQLDVVRLRGELGKRSSFVRATQELHTFVTTSYGQEAQPALSAGDEIWPLVERASTLLKTRYTGDQYWRNGRSLFMACKDVAESETCKPRLEEYLKSCSDALGEEETEPVQQANTQQPRNSFLFEGQLSGEATPAPRLQGADLMEMLMAQALAPGATTADGASSAADMEGLQDMIQEVLAVSAEEAQQQPSGPPPASKKVVASLPKEIITESRLKELGGGEVECTVCRESFGVGDELQCLPCKHVFHPPCLAPWLSQHNSCPVCRHELPTDDMHYENRKERDREEAEAESGRNNALSHSEFLYI